MNHRMQIQNLEWKYQEMSELQHISIGELENHPHLSSYVRDFLPLIQASAKKIYTTPSVHYTQFVSSTTGRNRNTIPML